MVMNFNDHSRAEIVNFEYRVKYFGIYTDSGLKFCNPIKYDCGRILKLVGIV